MIFFITGGMKKKEKKGREFWVGGGNKRKPGTDHVIVGPMRGLEKTAPDGAIKQTEKQTNMATI